MEQSSNRIVFMGTPAIAASVLEKLIDLDANVVLAVTQPDKKTGRRQNLVPSEVKKLAEANGIEVFQPAKISSDFKPIADLQPDLIITCAYGQFLPQALLDIPKHGVVNLHGSLLPAYRGGAPIQRAIMNGDEKSGMSLMKTVMKMDAGPVADQDVIDILPQENSSDIFIKMGQSAARLVEKNLDALLDGSLEFTDQDESKATLAKIIKKEEEHLDLSKSDKEIVNAIRGLAMQPGGYVSINGKKLKILEGDYVSEKPLSLGEIFIAGKGKIGMSLHEGNYYFKTVQMEGKPVSDAKSFANGQGRNLQGMQAR